MSLEIARQTDRDNPELLQTNIGATCHQFTYNLYYKFKTAGRDVAFIGKTAGEGQYIPPSFMPRTVTGLDGKPYTITGISHDALWLDGKQYDTIGAANEHNHPIYRKSTEPFWSFDPSDGPQIRAVPVWNEIPAHAWRPNNPPIKELGDPVVVPPPQPQYPPYPFPEDTVDGAGVALFADFAQAGNAPNPQMFRFAFRVAYSWLTKEVADLPASVAKHRKEWRALLGLPPQ